MTTNPFFQPFQTPHGVPPFAQITTEHFLPAIKQNIASALEEIDKITANPEAPDFHNTIEALESTGTLLGNTTSVLFNLNSAHTSPEIQKVAMEASPLLSEFQNDISQNEALFARVKQVYASQKRELLDQEQKTLLEKTYKGFIRSGANLTGEKKEAYRKISMELAELELKFGENTLAETNRYELHITNESDLQGLPEENKKMAAKLAAKKDKEGWIFTLQAPSYVPFMENADNRALREEFFKAYMSKCIKGDELDNRAILKRVVQLRLEKAKLLGYASYAAYVLEERMAESRDKVEAFLNDLLQKAQPKAKAEYEEIVNFASSIGHDTNIQRWDWAYLSEKLKKQKYQLNDELLRPYFQLENVLNGAFEVAGKLYGVSFEKNTQIPVYHEEVDAYEVLDASGDLLAVFYTDFFPRDSKRGGAWMTNYREQCVVEGEEQRPVVSIVCNFTPPSDDTPSLLTFDEVSTLFHEFGHALHSIFSKVKYASIAGTNVFWDFVELPSQIMENWVVERECLDLFAKHYQTGEALPQEYIERIKAFQKYHQAYQTMRQVSFALLDIQWHGMETFDASIDVLAFEKEVFKSTDLFPAVPNTSMSAQFGHIFAGGYASGYYSYKWAEVLDADAFAYFKQNGIFNAEVAAAFKANILSKGGSEHPMELYRRFRKQEPTPDALLERSGLVEV